MIQEGITIYGTKEVVHSLPVVVHILPIKVGVEIPNAIEWRAGWTALNEPVRPHHVPDHFQPLPVRLDGVTRLIGDLIEVNARDILQIVVLTVKFVVIESPIVQGGELLLQKINDLGIGVIQRGSLIIQNDAFRRACTANTNRDAVSTAPA